MKEDTLQESTILFFPVQTGYSTAPMGFHGISWDLHLFQPKASRGNYQRALQRVLQRFYFKRKISSLSASNPILLLSGAVKALCPPGFNFLPAPPKTEISNTALIQLPRHQEVSPTVITKPWSLFQEENSMKGNSTPPPPKQCLASLTIRKFLLVSNPYPSSCRSTQLFLPWPSLWTSTQFSTSSKE